LILTISQKTTISQDEHVLLVLYSYKKDQLCFRLPNSYEISHAICIFDYKFWLFL